MRVTVELAAARLDVDEAEVARAGAALSEDERERAARFVFAEDRRRFTVARGRLRAWLGEAAGEPPEALRFATGPHGKPVLVGRPAALHFNVSHSGERVLLARSWAAAVGVDVEAVRPLDDLAALAERVLAPPERASLAALDEAARPETFLVLWTRKEAVLKASGRGLSSTLRDFSVLARGGIVALEGDPGADTTCTVADVALETGYVAALAVMAARVTVPRVAWLDRA